MMYVGQTPWHQQGIKLDTPPNAGEAIKAAGLDWSVEKRPLYTPCGGKGELTEVQGFHSVVRKDKSHVLGVVGKTWQPLQNRDAFAFFDPFVEGKLAEYHTAGSLKNGQLIWVLAKLKSDPMQVVKGDVVEKYLLLSNAHDGKAAINVRFTPVRVVCWNTLTMAERDDASPYLRIRHARNLTQTLQKVQEVVDITNRTFAGTLEQFQFLAKRQVKNIDRFIGDVLKMPIDAKEPPRALNNIVQLFESGKGQDNPKVKGTYWAAYNAVTEWVDHQRGRDGTRLEAAWYGEGRRLKQRALEVATKMAKAA
ncbi:MAG: DUF932 domain-containing protein [Phycisphaerae bacterium]|nr:DUF932 domain-containing protein [Phycisphaerae bacterium]